jgi:hypothetical protein
MKALRYNQTPYLNLNSPIEDVPEPETPFSLERRIADQFTRYCSDRHDKLVVLKDPTTMKISIKTSLEPTRYHPKGQERIKEKIHRRLGHYQPENGLLMTLTYRGEDTSSKEDPGIPKTEAWRDLGLETRRFMDGVNKWRKAHHLGKVKRYIRVVEDQKARGYPAPHIWFPGLIKLAPIGVLQHLWPCGSLDLKRSWSDRPAAYIQKYITKMDGRYSMMSFMWYYHLRLFSTSRDYVYQTENVAASKYRFSGAGGYFRTKELVEQLIAEGYSCSDPRLIQPRGS